jgi:peroxiredoxin Q/BCP
MEIGDKVPDTSVLNQDGEPVSLKDFRGKPIVLFFFPKADTPG